VSVLFQTIAELVRQLGPASQVLRAAHQQLDAQLEATQPGAEAELAAALRDEATLDPRLRVGGVVTVVWTGVEEWEPSGTA
jgi:hypothetical protein